MDEIVQELADYTFHFKNPNKTALETAFICLEDSLGCALLALNHEECVRLLGPYIPFNPLLKGARVIGTSWTLDPVQATFNLGSMIRWLDFNDTFLAKEWAHPSDNIAAILMVMDYLEQVENKTFTIKDLLLNVIQSYEIQGSLALNNSLNQQGFDHVLFVKIATAAIVTKLLGGSKQHISHAISQCFLDGAPLRAYRHFPNTGPRKSWAAADASSRGVFLAFLTMKNEKGYASSVTTPKWGFQDVIMNGKMMVLPHEMHSYIIENILFKVGSPAEFHAQTAIEAAIQIHPILINQLDQIHRIDIFTHEAALKIIDKQGPLFNYADRDHCMQYMVAIALLKGSLEAEDYSDEIAKNPAIDALREKIYLQEKIEFSQNYLNPKVRSIANALEITLKNGKKLPPILIEFPIGHPKRRKEAIPLLKQKFKKNLMSRYSFDKINTIIDFFSKKNIKNLKFSQLMDLFF